MKNSFEYDLLAIAVTNDPKYDDHIVTVSINTYACFSSCTAINDHVYNYILYYDSNLHCSSSGLYGSSL